MVLMNKPVHWQFFYQITFREKMYSTIAPMMGMPSHRQAQHIRAQELSRSIYMPGLNDWAFEIASKDTNRPLQNSMDGTRAVRIIELYNKEYLVGAAFSPDVRHFPSPDKLPNISIAKQHVASVRQHGSLVAESIHI